VTNKVIGWQHMQDAPPDSAATPNITEGSPDVEYVLKSAAVHDCIELWKIRL
jgi:hypothetical protein